LFCGPPGEQRRFQCRERRPILGPVGGALARDHSSERQDVKGNALDLTWDRACVLRLERIEPVSGQDHIQTLEPRASERWGLHAKPRNPETPRIRGRQRETGFIELLEPDVEILRREGAPSKA